MTEIHDEPGRGLTQQVEVYRAGAYAETSLEEHYDIPQ